jgi:hypothetical protein
MNKAKTLRMKKIKMMIKLNNKRQRLAKKLKSKWDRDKIPIKK